LDDDINLADTGLTGKAYEKSTIAYKYYEKENLPPDKEIEMDLKHLLQTYQDYVDKGLKDEKRSWIFQSHPDYFDLVASLKVFKEHRWTINRYKDKIHAGDTVYLWQAGKNAGIYAIGTVATEPALMPEDKRELQFSKSTEKVDKLRLRSIVKINKVLKTPVLRENLLKEPKLSDLLIFRQPAGTNFPVSQTQSDLLMKLINGVTPLDEYTKEDALKDLFIDEAEFDYILSRLKSKKNIILQGPPGTGKTFIAKRLAYFLIGFMDDSKVSMIQFHQSYSYEDFIQGFRPNDEGKFDLKNGIFYEFCKSAMEDKENKFVFIIDEINRGNLSKIFGEMLMLIESDKRGPDYSVPLTYGKDHTDKFYISSNVYLIGTMNTADRSLAMVDYALRRRFGFINLKPEYSSSKFRHYLKSFEIDDDLISKIINRMTNLNEKITEDTKNLGAGYQIGHSYFCPDNTEDTYDENWYSSVVRSEIEPLLTEYWFDDPERVKKHISNLLS